MADQLAIIEDRECACGHFYGNHRWMHVAGLGALWPGNADTWPCTRTECGCRDYTPGEPLAVASAEAEHPQELIDQLQLLGGRWGQVEVAEAAASLMLPGWTPSGAGEEADRG